MDVEDILFRSAIRLDLSLDTTDYLLETTEAVVMRAHYPMASYHFLVVAKTEELKNVTELRQHHLPLLDHMLVLANNVIVMQSELGSQHFRMGFRIHINDVWNRLTLHVCSNDFCSPKMLQPHHYNAFNTDLFQPFEIVHQLLALRCTVDGVSSKKYYKLMKQLPLQCSQCHFHTKIMEDLKKHLAAHWIRRELERALERRLEPNSELMLDVPRSEALAWKLTEEAAGTSQSRGTANVPGRRNPARND